MERLTFRDDEVMCDCPVKVTDEEDDVAKFCSQVCDEWQGKCPYMKMAQKLKHYEDLAEQGRLVELPVAIGDTVYQIDKDRTRCSVHNEKFDESWCLGCEEFECDSKVVYSIYELTPKSIDLIIAIIMPKLGKTVFLTKSEAEQALAERQKNENIKNT